MTESVDQLIANLGKKPRPTHKVPNPAVLFVGWLLGTSTYIALLLALAFHPRPDLLQKLGRPLFMAEVVCLVGLAATTGYSAMLLSFPDLYQKRRIAYAPLAFFAAFVITMAFEWLADNPPAPPPEHSMECCGAITLFAVPLALWMFWRIRRMAPVHPALAGSCALLSSFSVSALALRLSEQTDSIHHLIEWHYLPMIFIGIIGLWLGQKIFKW